MKVTIKYKVYKTNSISIDIPESIYKERYRMRDYVVGYITGNSKIENITHDDIEITDVLPDDLPF